MGWLLASRQSFYGSSIRPQRRHTPSLRTAEAASHGIGTELVWQLAEKQCTEKIP